MYDLVFYFTSCCPSQFSKCYSKVQKSNFEAKSIKRSHIAPRGRQILFQCICTFTQTDYEVVQYGECFYRYSYYSEQSSGMLLVRIVCIWSCYWKCCNIVIFLKFFHVRIGIRVQFMLTKVILMLYFISIDKFALWIYLSFRWLFGIWE